MVDRASREFREGCSFGLAGIGLKLLLQPAGTRVLLQTRSDPYQ